MNLEEVRLPLVKVELFQAKEVCRAILHTVLFNRALGVVSPQEVDSEYFDVSYVKFANEGIEKAVESAIQDFHKEVLSKLSSGRVQLTVGFYKSKVKKYFFSKAEERLFWERWVLELELQDGAMDFDERSRRQEALEHDLRAVLQCVVSKVNAKRDHIPPVSSTEFVTFPFDISFPNKSDAWSFDSFRKMLQVPLPHA